LTILVTGGSGLVGSHVIEALRARDVPVRALVRPPAAPLVRSLGAEPVVGDVADPRTWSRATAGGIAGIVHAAAVVDQQAPVAAYAVNVTGTRCAIDAARAARVRLVHVSSVSVYGGSADYGPTQERRTEDTPFRPLAERDHYARSKREAEELVRSTAAAGGLTAIAIRPNVVYGARDRLFTPRLVRAIRAPIVPVIGPGTNHLSCVYAGNVAQAIVAALEAPCAGFGAFNVTTDAAPLLTMREFLAAVAEACGRRVRFVHLPVGVARFAIALWSGPALARAALAFVTGENPHSSERARGELGWAPAVTPREGIARAVAWIRTNEKPGSQPGLRPS
jgi:nucleoside-diphosphate-sugar epimerase